MPISGGAFNPAVGLGPIAVQALQGGEWSGVWLYLFGPIAGALLATAVFRLQHPETP